MSLLVVPALLYVAFCAYLYGAQRSLIYFPTPESTHAGAEVVPLATDGATLKVLAVRRAGPQALIYFGGNAEDVGLNIDELARALPQHSLYLVNYRGYGGSTGRPSETDLFADALAVHDHVQARHPDISVVGRSLGAGVATYLASRRPTGKLVLVTPFDSLVNVARGYYRLLPVELLLKDRYDSASRAAEVTAPVLVVIAERDEIVPRARSQALVEAFAAEQVRVSVIPGARHNTLDAQPAYLEAVSAFLE
jgi:pimeloyl-ACP methyl ester carboxylesterase